VNTVFSRDKHSNFMRKRKYGGKPVRMLNSAINFSMTTGERSSWIWSGLEYLNRTLPPGTKGHNFGHGPQNLESEHKKEVNQQ
jgi:hypothetical protein